MYRNEINMDVTINQDGYTLGGGTTQRFLTVTGSNITLLGSGSAVLTFPLASSSICGTTITNQYTQGQQFQAGFQVTGSVILADTITIKGGSPATNYLLKSDATGVASWSSGSIIKRVQVFTTPGAGTYTPWGGMLFCRVYVTGGGGASGNCTNTSACSGGGGAGGTAIKVYSRSDIGVSKALFVGSGGTAGAPGSAGTASTFGTGTTMTGSAGGGTAQSASASISFGGRGGFASGGDLNLSGSSGTFGFPIPASPKARGGNGGPSYWGGGPACPESNAAAIAGTTYGSGASGAAAIYATDRNGANGANGLIYIEEYGIG